MLTIGSVIDGKYKILNVIGRGGMSVVYLAMNERVNKQWAVKEVRKEGVRDLWMEQKEIEMMKKLKHPHLPSVVDVIERRDSLLIVMDYIEGRSLQDLLAEQGALPQEQVLRWAGQLCEVLFYLHTREPAIIYRDMKPANVMLKPDGSVMLIDFGAAREYKPRNLKDTVSLGTRGYAAPEQYERTGQSDARTDIYGLGVMLFQLLTGESPHALRPIGQVNPSFSSGLEAIIVKCTQIKKEERYQSCMELKYALEHYWEWDSVYRNRLKRSFFCFLAPAVLTVFFAIGALVFRSMELRIKKHNYEAYLLAASHAVTREEEIANYQKAVSLDPVREEAYLALLQNTFLEDQLLTREESARLRAVLIDYGDGKRTNEERFLENPEGYGRFAYAAGLAYYYKFQEKSSKKYARGYLEIAAASEALAKEQRERAKKLSVIADYYARVGLPDEAGDASVTYRDYWEDLTAVSAGNLVEADNERTALVMYQELVSQMVSRAARFREDGVRKEEMEEQLRLIRSHLDTDFQAVGGRTAEELRKLKQELNQAEKRINSAYRQGKEEEREDGTVP